jgi:3',5'-cyclic AMP phosphodiesterase CpdA
MTTTIVQVSDPHIVESGRELMPGVDTSRALEHAVERILALAIPPDAVVVTGDLVNSGRVEQYRNLRRILDPLGERVVLVPGNHDDRDAMRAVFGDHPELGVVGPCRGVVNLGELDLVVLDSVVDGEAGGSVGPEQIDWLREVLADPDRPRMVAVHHPPFATGIAHMDAMGLDATSVAALGEVIASARVLAVVAGHLHRFIATSWAGTTAMTAPGTAHAIALDLDEYGTGAWTDEAPGMLLHRFHEGRLVTHLQTLGPFTVHPFA